MYSFLENERELVFENMKKYIQVGTFDKLPKPYLKEIEVCSWCEHKKERHFFGVEEHCKETDCKCERFEK